MITSRILDSKSNSWPAVILFINGSSYHGEKARARYLPETSVAAVTFHADCSCSAGLSGPANIIQDFKFGSTDERVVLIRGPMVVRMRQEKEKPNRPW